MPGESTRFKKGEAQPGAGRPRGSKDRITAAFLDALAADFEATGVVSIQMLRKSDLSTYMRIIAAIPPKEIEIKRPLDGMDDSAILQAIETLTEIMRASAPAADEAGPRLNRDPEDDEPKVLQ